MPIIFLLPWLEEPENFDSCTEKCCPPIMRGSASFKSSVTDLARGVAS